ncbi:tumor necrosis factor receptor superfamily member 8 isoform X2 [Monodelphis domestica]|uniref:tumor necrosis factor receptor superfamily member 8 isoform X2 n=1 Tax=Monodelphis domestica TaxID=13616 RepID=UPI0024E1B499|nr:tumor necrosis factor receptor superfamily member 8 isoform X2 [Monodelphis domestica]
MATPRAALGLLLLGAVGALPQKQEPCGSRLYRNESSGRCCYHCPSGQVPRQSCPQGPEGCRKECNPDYYLEDERKSLCLGCVNCSRGDLVEKMPCTWNSPRVCECKDGMFCTTEATHSCARCKKHSLCPAGTRIKFQGTSKKNTVCESCPPGTFSSHSSSKDCQPHTSCTTMIRQMGNSTHDNICAAPDPSTFPMESVVNPHTVSPTSLDIRDSSNATADSSSTHDTGTISPSLTGRPNPGSDSLFWVVTVFAVTLGFVLFLICQQRACRKGILQKLHLFSGQAFQPKVTSVGYSPRKNCQPGILPRNAEKSSEKQGLISSRPALEINQHVTSSSREPIGVDLNAAENFSPGDIPEPRVATEHTNNQIENIYILKADTVIVGSVARVSEGRNPSSTLGQEEAALETDQSPRYPEQETELSPGGHVEVTFSVEEEGKEYHWPTAVSTE